MQFFVLMSIRGHREASVSELTAFLRMDQTTLTRSLDVLERNLWIERVPKPDRRKRVFRLTQAGLDVLSQAEPLWATAQSHILSTLGHDDWQAAKPILGRLLKISCDATLGVAAAHPPESPAAGKNFVAGNS